ncbi:phage tail assembly chaperone [Listeria booriae]|uniref:phage tail assembly chaperone n=1 Tax=Listeria booriae TaxID=1552123 RepID=UPI00162448C4|nr:phage portal protein [Listeria booriae]MBC1233163.1 phage portal protein [Listeria booriae]
MTKEKVSELAVAEGQVLDITAFLPGKYEEKAGLERVISKRFKDANGTPIKFIFENVATDRIDELRKECTKQKPAGRNRQPVETFDSDKFNATLALESTVFPKFNDPKLLEAYNTPSAIEVAKAILSIPGDYMTWITAASEVNGFDDEIDEEESMIEEAKN